MKRNIIAIICLAFILDGCKKKGCLESSGVAIMQSRPASSFHKVVINDNINVVFTQDATESIRVQAGEKLQSFIACDIKNNILTISNNSSCSWMRGASENITVYVGEKNMDNIELHGSGTISSTNTITSPDLTIDAFEAVSVVNLSLQCFNASFSIREENAIYNISGTVNTCYLYCGQKGTMDLRNLQATECEIDYRSIFNSFVWVKNQLKVRVQYKGSVYYKGTPQISYEHYNDGRLLPM